MTDPLTTEARSSLMARVGRSNTAPEMIVRRMLHARGWRYRVHRKGLPGTPDIVFPSRRVAIFVHGYFWHGHSCRLGRLPKSREEFWHAKIDANRKRDTRKIEQLVETGWRAMTVWQCGLVDRDRALAEIEHFLRGGAQVAETETNAWKRKECP